MDFLHFLFLIVSALHIDCLKLFARTTRSISLIEIDTENSRNVSSTTNLVPSIVEDVHVLLAADIRKKIGYYMLRGTLYAVDFDLRESRELGRIGYHVDDAPSTIDYDWITGNLYAGVQGDHDSSGRIEVCAMSDISKCAVIVHSGIDYLYSLVLDPSDGLIYWQNGITSNIEIAHMNGSNHDRYPFQISDSSFVTKNSRLSSLTLHRPSRRIYFVRSLGSVNEIVACDLQGSRDCAVVAIADDIIHLAVSKDHIIWSMSVRGSLMYCEINNCDATKTMVNVVGVETFVVLDPELQPTQLSHSNPCAKKNFGCSHFCLLSHEAPWATCACTIGIALDNGRKICRRGTNKALFISALNGLYKVSLDTPDFTAMQVKIDGYELSQKVDDVEFDSEQQKLYWVEGVKEDSGGVSVLRRRVVKRADVDGLHTEEFLSVPLTVSTIRIDPSSRNLYWLDQATASRIGVTSLTTQYSKTILSYGFQRAKSFAINHRTRLLTVASDKEDHGVIETCTLDGKNRTKLHSLPRGSWVLSIDFDSSKNIVYWTETNSTDIAWMNLNDGTSMRIEFASNVRLAQPNIVTVLDDTIFSTSFAERALLRVTTNGTPGARRIHAPIFGASGMKFVSMNNELSKKDYCSVMNGGCQHICISSEKKKMCFCADGYSLAKDGASCVVLQSRIVAAMGQTPNRIYLISLEKPLQMDELISNYYEYFKTISSFSVDTRRSEIYIAGKTMDGMGIIARTNMPKPSTAKEVPPSAEVSVILSDESVTGVFSIAVDEVSRNIFWSNSLTNRLEVCNANGSFRKVISWRNIFPRQLLLYQPHGSLYFVNAADNETIKRVPLSGEAHGGVDVVTEIANVVDIAIDEEGKQIYWAEHNSKCMLSVATLNGQHRELLYVGKERSPGKLATLNGDLYYSDNSGTEISSSIGSYDGDEFQTVHVQLSHISSFKIVQNASKNLADSNFCTFNATNCEQLCLVHLSEEPNSIANVFSSRTHDFCACADHYEAKTPTARSNLCKPSADIIFGVSTSGVYMGSLRRLPDKSFNWKKSAITRVPLKIRRTSSIVSFSFHARTRTFFWVDLNDPSSINFSKVDHPYEKSSITAKSSFHCNYFVSLAVDEVGNQLYTSCYRNSTGFIAVYSIMMSPINLRYVGVIVSGDVVGSSTGYPSQPRDIALFPLRNILFYVDTTDVDKKSTSSIVKCSLDGKKCSVYLTEGVSSSTKLQADPNIESSRLFYTSKSGIWSRDVASALSHVRHHYESVQEASDLAVAPIDDYSILIAESHQQKFRVMDLPSEEIVPEMADTFLLARFTTLEIQSKTCQGSDCSHMCRYARDKDTPASEKFECMCPLGFALSNGRECILSVNCAAWQFACADGQQCIHAAKKCDRVNDCLDHSDEASSQCDVNGDLWPCDDGINSVNRTFVCDGFTQCADTSDELHCRCERPHEFFDCGAMTQSNSTKCIPRAMLCDRVPDCELEEDENAIICHRLGRMKNDAGWLYSVLLALVVLLILLLVMFCCARKSTPASPVICRIVERRESNVLLPSASFTHTVPVTPNHIALHSYSVTNSSSTCVALPPPNSSWTTSKVSSSIDIPPQRFYAPPPSTASLSTYGVVRPTDIRMLPRSSHSRRRKTRSPSQYSSTEELQMQQVNSRTVLPVATAANFEHQLGVLPRRVDHSSSSSLSSHSSEGGVNY